MKVRENRIPIIVGLTMDHSSKLAFRLTWTGRAISEITVCRFLDFVARDCQVTGEAQKAETLKYSPYYFFKLFFALEGKLFVLKSH